LREGTIVRVSERVVRSMKEREKGERDNVKRCGKGERGDNIKELVDGFSRLLKL
jgi:hypothetical protein